MVSIHTPTKGVTEGKPEAFRYIRFQSTHPRRVWRHRGRGWKDMQGFNPHTHEGCDCQLQLSLNLDTSFNPHTHEGCDWLFRGDVWGDSCFNPHTHEGCDGERCYATKHLWRFQSTHPRRVWLTYPCIYLLTSLFQSTHPRRVWLNKSQFL